MPRSVSVHSGGDNPLTKLSAAWSGGPPWDGAHLPEDSCRHLELNSLVALQPPGTSKGKKIRCPMLLRGGAGAGSEDQM